MLPSQGAADLRLKCVPALLCGGGSSSSSGSNSSSTGASVWHVLRVRQPRAPHAAPPPHTLPPTIPRYLPSVIKGDLDSIRPEVLAHYRCHGVPVVDSSADQDTTDLTKCVMYAQEHMQVRGGVEASSALSSVHSVLHTVGTRVPGRAVGSPCL